MKKIKLAIVYQVVFHYRVPFYKEIESDNDIESILLHGNGIKGTKIQNAPNSLKNTSKLFSLQFPYRQNNEKKYFSFFPFLFFKLTFTKPDVILIEGVTSIINALSVYVYAKLFRKKIIFWSLGKVQNKKSSKAREKLDRLVLALERNADAIFTYSSVGEQYFLNRGIPQEKIFKGVNVLDTRKILSIKKPEATNFEEFRILFVGSIIPEKNLEILIEAFLSLENKNAFLDIVGSGGIYYKSLVERYDNLSDRITFHGRITEGLDKYYLNSDIFILPGLGGLAISEAMAYGLPVICSIADGTEIDLIDSNSGFIIENINQKTLHDKLLFLYNNRAFLEKCGLNAKERIQNRFSFDNFYTVFKDSVSYVTGN